MSWHKYTLLERLVNYTMKKSKTNFSFAITIRMISHKDILYIQNLTTDIYIYIYTLTKFFTRLFLFIGILLEQYLMLNRRNSAVDGGSVNHEKLARNTSLFMCTTMYHEADYEMEQLLHSVANLDRNRHIVGRHLESHIFFDGCLQGEVMNEYVLTLCSLLEKTLRIKLANVVKIKTPYGMQMKWKLPGGTEFTIHLKDNKKVNKQTKM